VGRSARVPGFRPGKLPAKVIRQRFGEAVVKEMTEEAVREGAQQAMKQNGLKVAGQPEILDFSFSEGQSLAFTLRLEVYPEITFKDFRSIRLERLNVRVDPEMVEERLRALGNVQMEGEAAPEGHQAETGNVLVFDMSGLPDSQAAPEGGAAEAQPTEAQPAEESPTQERKWNRGITIRLGAGQLTPEIESQLLGVRLGEERQIVLGGGSLPDAGEGTAETPKQPVTVDVRIQEIRLPPPLAFDDAFAKTHGFETIALLRERIEKDLDQSYRATARSLVKRRLLDQLADAYDFPVPESMLEAEFQSIWTRVGEALEQGNLPEEDRGKGEETLRAEYRRIAERRVRLGLLLAEIGHRNNIEVKKDDLVQALMAEARRYGEQAQAYLRYHIEKPERMERFHSPAFEEKVVSFLLELAQVEERGVTPEELRMAIAALEEEDEKSAPAATAEGANPPHGEEGHVCDHC
jgi:trigger factor